MSVRPCLVIPIYNHKETIGTTVSSLVSYGWRIFIVDDGSDEATQAILTRLAACEPLVHLTRLPENEGKGAAVVYGLRAAYAAGYTHALQIDADGQHDARDVPRFVEQARRDPHAVVAGKPIYDRTAPKARRYGRYLTHVWVWLETLSFAIGDSLCGFRFYPLAETCALLAQHNVAKRMDFDVEIIVRLAWRGLPIVNVPTRVSYPEGGVSHFDMLRDNVRISRTHTRLVIGMLVRFPWIIAGRIAGRPHERSHWSRLSERGNALGLWLLACAYRLLGRRLARVMLYLVVAWFFLTAPRARHASLQYLQRLSMQLPDRHPRPIATWRASFRHMLAFGQSALDKLEAWMSGMDDKKIDFPNRGDFEGLVASGRGAVIIGSHLGNLEMMRAIASDKGLKGINAVVYTDHAARFARLLANTNTKYTVNLFQVNELGPDTAIAFAERIERGEVLVIVGDRTPPAENGRVTCVPFLESPAPFPQGPWILASLLGCPVYLFFCLRHEEGYRIHFEHFAERIELPRKEREARLRDLIRRYAARLELHCREAPYQWFNFFDFWDNQARLEAGKT